MAFFSQTPSRAYRFRRSRAAGAALVRRAERAVFRQPADTAALLFQDAVKIAVYSQAFGGYQHMSQELTDFIIHWEVESYRKSQMK